MPRLRFLYFLVISLLTIDGFGQTPHAEISRMKSIIERAESRADYKALAKAYHAKALKEFEYFARVKTATNDLDRAIDIYKTYRSTDLKRAEAHTDMANIYSYLNNFSDAKIHYEKALEIYQSQSSAPSIEKGQITHLLANIDIVNNDLNAGIGKINEAFDMMEELQDSSLQRLHIITKKYLLNKKDDLIPAPMRQKNSKMFNCSVLPIS